MRYSRSADIDDDADMYMVDGPAAAQTISAADMAKLSETANAAMLDPNGHLMQ